MNPIRFLVLKDLRVHWRAAGVLLLGWPIGVRLLVFAQQSSTGADQTTRPAVVAAISALLFVAVAAGLATMLVERERARDTFSWLRTLPLSDAHIVAGKCATWLVFHAVGAVAWWAVLGRVGPAPTVPQAISIWCATAVIGSLALVSQLAWAGGMAQATPVAVVALGLLGAASRHLWPWGLAAMIEAWRGTWRHLPFWAGCLAVYALLVAVAYWGFHREETHRSVD